MTTDPIPAELSAEPYTAELPDGPLTLPHESTLPAMGKDRAVQTWDDRGNRGVAIELLRLALDERNFARLEKLTDAQLLGTYRAWMDHCGLGPEKSDASTS